MNNLGGMVFIVAGIAVAYLLLTGRLSKIVAGQSTQTSTNPNPNAGNLVPGGGGNFGGGASGSWNPNPTANVVAMNPTQFFTPGSTYGSPLPGVA